MAEKKVNVTTKEVMKRYVSMLSSKAIKNIIVIFNQDSDVIQKWDQKREDELQFKLEKMEKNFKEHFKAVVCFWQGFHLKSFKILSKFLFLYKNPYLLNI